MPFGGFGPSQGAEDLKHDIMKYCLKKKGKWWANHFFRNEEVNELYAKLREKNLDELKEMGVIG